MEPLLVCLGSCGYGVVEAGLADNCPAGSAGIVLEGLPATKYCCLARLLKVDEDEELHMGQNRWADRESVF